MKKEGFKREKLYTRIVNKRKGNMYIETDFDGLVVFIDIDKRVAFVKENSNIFY